MEKIYMYVHVPRTGGTYFESSGPNPTSRENDDYLYHYKYVDRWSDYEYTFKDIPMLAFRSRAQQTKLKLLSGHSIFSQSHKWLRIHRQPVLLTTIRNPVERVLSSFNYRYSKIMLRQDQTAFSRQTPAMEDWAVRQNKGPEDYDTLYEWYQDATAEHNLQCKWIVKTFLKYDNYSWKEHPAYLQGPDQLEQNIDLLATTWPEIFYEVTPEIQKVDWFDLASRFLSRFWWIGTTDTLTQDTKDFYQLIELPHKETGSRNNHPEIKPYWTLEDVMAQPDIGQLHKAEHHDIKLYDRVKKFKRPF